MAIAPDFPLAFDALAQLKRALHQTLPKIPSSHLSEAIAFGLGFRTNAALQTQLNAGGGTVAGFDSDRFSGRLAKLGHGPIRDVCDDVRVVQSILLARSDPGMVPRSPLERCAAYGVRILRKENGDFFAHHNGAGVVGPCHDEQEAAALACATWDF
ncbi:hypothetical protein GCT13_41210 [Paraburkholderia sp. CNPSo 3157]|uniref:Uncharacterized protein n=1 Tax=Paraburkholderia franconis TaxID=2654983 RepID=A0A7X1NJC6_9BURK|nr:hypothetical protein [Paraburkholderia franconis]MPW23030.1 hypothetical protein [Paraburkholderia franconis]